MPTVYSPFQRSSTVQWYHGTELIERIRLQRERVRKSRVSLVWIVAIFFIMVLMKFDMKFGTFINSLEYLNPVYPVLVTVFLSTCVIVFVAHLVRCLRGFLFLPNIELTVQQQKLFGVAFHEPGFVIVQPIVDTSPSPVAGPQYSPSRLTGSGSKVFGRSTQPCATRTPHGSPAFSSPDSYGTRWTGGVSSGSSGSPGSRLLNTTDLMSPQSVSMGSFSSSFNMSARGDVGGTSLMTPNGSRLSDFQQDLLTDRSGMKSKPRPSLSPNMSPLHSDNCISDQRSLDEFLNQQQLQRQHIASEAVHGDNSPQSFWSYGQSYMRHLPSLRDCRYQLAPRSPQSRSSSDEVAGPADSPQHTDDAWSRQGVLRPECVDRWVENLRKWLGKTVLERLVAEIDEVNVLLVRAGSDDIQIGEASLSTLKQMATLKQHQVPQLSSLLPYIDLVPNQEYLICRIRELASGGCMSAFKWNAGGDYKSKPWDESLPTDSAILLHLLCTYMDARLPTHPKFPDGKTFTSQHFVKVPDKPNLLERKDNLIIYQSRIWPPHFQVVIENTVWNIKPGRHNLFHAILFFLYHIKTKEHGLLRRINLGMSGINILWVFEL